MLRTRSGAPDWERRPELDRAASRIAHEVARTGRDYEQPVEGPLRAAGVAAHFRVIPIIQTHTGTTSSLRSAMEVWDSSTEGA